MAVEFQGHEEDTIMKRNIHLILPLLMVLSMACGAIASTATPTKTSVTETATRFVGRTPTMVPATPHSSPVLIDTPIPPLPVDNGPAVIASWNSHGPAGGSINTLVLDPVTPGTLYAGTDGK